MKELVQKKSIFTVVDLKKCLKSKTLIAWTGFVFVLTILIFLFFDAFYGGRNFRTMQDKISSIEEIDLTGLRELQASGGNTPRFFDVQRRLSHIHKTKIVVDAVGYFHGYVRGIPTNFLGYARPANSTYWHALRRLLLTGSTAIRPELVLSEAEEAKKYGFEYKSFLIGSKFVTDNETVDKFVAFIDSLSENVWVHFHCAQGKGRTTTMLVMLDILKNAPRVTLEDIIKRQHCLGSQNLLDAVLWKNGSYTQEQLDKRKKFIEDFYEFVCQRKAGGIQLWSEWKRQKQDV